MLEPACWNMNPLWRNENLQSRCCLSSSFPEGYYSHNRQWEAEAAAWTGGAGSWGREGTPEHLPLSCVSQVEMIALIIFPLRFQFPVETPSCGLNLQFWWHFPLPLFLQWMVTNFCCCNIILCWLVGSSITLLTNSLYSNPHLNTQVISFFCCCCYILIYLFPDVQIFLYHSYFLICFFSHILHFQNISNGSYPTLKFSFTYID